MFSLWCIKFGKNAIVCKCKFPSYVKEQHQRLLLLWFTEKENQAGLVRHEELVNMRVNCSFNFQSVMRVTLKFVCTVLYVDNIVYTWLAHLLKMKLFWTSEMYIWKQELGRVCYGFTLAISSIPPGAVALRPNAARSATCFTTKQHAWKTLLFTLIKSAFHHISQHANGLTMMTAL